jgi:eukaryotic-like serine/threonine-protein kinase
MHPEAPPTGSVIAGKYRVVRLLGAGGMGVVVEAVHVKLGHSVAVKLVYGVRESKPVMARLLHEARVAAQLPGDHICRAIDVGRTRSGDAFLVMELLIGRDLQAELDEHRRIPAREAVSLILQACEGIAEAHAIGLVHRDLKPANLFLSERRDGSRLIKVLDFGISMWTRSTSPSPAPFTSFAAGTPAYMAPEQFEIDARIDARCDQHAIAAVLYEMLTGAPPFIAENAHSLALLIAREAPRGIRETLPEIKAALEAAILRALSKSPDDRFPDLAAFARAIAPFGGEGARASARNVTSILAAAAASEGALELRASSPPPLPQKEISERPSAPDRAAGAVTPTLPSPSMPPGSRPDRARSRALSHAADGQASASRLTRPRLLAASSAALAMAAIGLTSLLLDTRDPPAVARSSLSLALPPIRAEPQRDARRLSGCPAPGAPNSRALAPAPEPTRERVAR